MSSSDAKVEHDIPTALANGGQLPVELSQEGLAWMLRKMCEIRYFEEKAEELYMRGQMNLTLSADHRVVDGATGARFLSDLRNALENPYLLI